MILIRDAAEGDAEVLAQLIGELGYPMFQSVASERIQALGHREDTAVLVADLHGQTAGVAAIHVIPLLHRPAALGRIVAFVISAEHRRVGIGTKLLRACEERLWSLGCERIEITSGNHREGAHHFYEGAGYEASSQRFLKHQPRPSANIR